MYIRFVIPNIDEDSGEQLGIFHALGNLRDEGLLSPDEEKEHELVREWFNRNLEKPSRFTASKPPHYRKPKKAISWFKDSAQEHIAQARAMVAILENHGVHVKLLTAKRVGYVVYEDEYQIVAEPFRKELRKRS